MELTFLTALVTFSIDIVGLQNGTIIASIFTQKSKMAAANAFFLNFNKPIGNTDCMRDSCIISTALCLYIVGYVCLI